MSILVLAVTVAMASMLLWAGLEKARNLASFAAVVRQLGAPERGARAVATLLLALELGTGLGLIFRPRSVGTLAGVVVLAAIFAGAGFLAIRRDERIRCGCFGPHGDAPLGKPQLVAFPLWLFGAAVLSLAEPAPSYARAASLFAVVALTMTALRAVSAVRAASGARGDRRSAREMLVWLSR